MTTSVYFFNLIAAFSGLCPKNPLGPEGAE